MKQYVRNKLIFTGTPDKLKSLVKELACENGDPISFEKIIPLTDSAEDVMEKEWGVSGPPEELDWILYRNDTILEYSFDTADKPPVPVFAKLAELYPDYQMKVNYAFEDYGVNCGIYESAEGSSKLVFSEPDDPLVFACEIWDVDPDEEMQERMINAYEE